jgi:hypothetical protein
MISNTVLSILILVLGVSYVFLLGLPFSIAYFYEKVFKKRVFPYLFIISGGLFIVSFLIFLYDFFSDTGSAFFASGGVLLAVASLRLYYVMTGRD